MPVQTKEEARRSAIGLTIIMGSISLVMGVFGSCMIWYMIGKPAVKESDALTAIIVFGFTIISCLLTALFSSFVVLLDSHMFNQEVKKALTNTEPES